MNLNALHNVYLIGIGGIGMSALASYFVSLQKPVAGFDKTTSALTTSLQAEGVDITFEDKIERIPPSFLNANNTLVIYTPAISEENILLTYFKNNAFTLLKRSEVLGLITQNAYCMAVAGTHGKTTTTSMLGHIMQPYKATSFLGGISENYQSNLILGEDKIIVVEADEFDRSFLQLTPTIACITSMDADHLDIYKEEKQLQQTFVEFANKVSQKLIVAKGLPIAGLTYAIEEEADIVASNIRIENGTHLFDVSTPKGVSIRCRTSFTRRT